MSGKTGTLTGVKGLIGFIDVLGGSIMRVVILLEGEGVNQDDVYRPIWERFLADAVDEYASGPSAEAIAPASAVTSPPP